MILNQSETWAKTASASGRADFVAALAKALLYSDLGPTRRQDAERVLTEYLDDPSPLVRRALAEALASAKDAPHHIILALADGQADIAAIVLARSPILSDAELIDCAAGSEPAAQKAIASRAGLSAPVAAALAEVGALPALLALASNRSAAVPTFSLHRMIERFGDSADLRETLLSRPDLPGPVRVDLVAATTRALAAFVGERDWISGERMRRVAAEAQDRAALTIAVAHRDEQPALISHLRENGQLTVGFAFRAILSGKLELFKAILCDLSGTAYARVDSLTRLCDSTGFAALYRKAGLPPDLLPAFRAALQAAREASWTPGADLSRSAIERVLTGCEAINSGELDKLVVLLRRLQTEAARDEARAVVSSRGLDMAPLAEPLLLCDLDAGDERQVAQQDNDRKLFHRERRTLQIDLAAIEAELCAA